MAQIDMSIPDKNDDCPAISTTEELGDVSKFAERFRRLTGNLPLSWQKRLFEHLSKNDFPRVLDLPTGMGKTSVMALWLIAREMHPDAGLPTRLIYVVDRRTVVDQATSQATRLQTHFGVDKLAISTLRGQLADNREWSKDPTKPAIIVGTVDLIGSALLFSGYRSSFRRRPLEAGLLGQDSLLVLDEAHLSKPFEKLVSSISKFQGRQGSPMRIICMSATSLDDNSQRFTLDHTDLSDPVIKERFEAGKRLSIITLTQKDKLTDRLAKAAIELAVPSDSTKTPVVGQRIVVFVRRPDDATAIAKIIREHGETKSNRGPFHESVDVLTGTMRGLERDELIEKSLFRDRWLNGDLRPNHPANQQSVFLISTTAGEVGFDLNADHMVCDVAPLDSMIQRLGRVNRRGKGNATVCLVLPSDPNDETDFGKACIETARLLTDDMDVSPKAMSELKSRLTDEQLKKVCTPEPATVELTDILLDAWSMTSITTPMPGRPEVGPWLRGIADHEPPQTTIAWRAELDLPGFGQLGLEDIEEWFDTHRILAHETLTVPTSDAAKWFVDRWRKLTDQLTDEQQTKLGRQSIIVDRAGLKRVTIKSLIEQLVHNIKNTDPIRNAELILPASFGGIQRGAGLLYHAEPKTETKKNESPTDEQAEIPERILDEIDVADLRERSREVVTKLEGGEPELKPLVTGKKPGSFSRFALTLQSNDDRTVRLVSYISRTEKPETGQHPQSLEGHITDVRKRADMIIKALHLEEDDPVRLAFQIAADWHDHGKNRERWQRLLVFPKHFVKPDKPMAKSGGEMKRDSSGYRHEYGSLREFHDAFQAGTLFDPAGKPVTQEVFDIASHLIAAHHGRGRPHFPQGGFDPASGAEARSSEVHTDAIRRFARLQRKYGWWHLAWLESLLRCADAMASANPETGIDNSANTDFQPAVATVSTQGGVTP